MTTNTTAGIDLDKLPHLYRFDRYHGACKLAEGIGVHATSMAEAIEKARDLARAERMPIDGVEMQFVSNAPCARRCEICEAYDLARRPTSGSTNAMCERKTNDIMQREGYQKTGYVLMKDDPAARICVSDQGAVSWFTREQWNWLMFNRDHVEFQWPKPIGARASRSDGTAAAVCQHCGGEGIDGEPGDEPGTGHTWKCAECNGTGRAATSGSELADERPLFEAWARKKVGMPDSVPFCWESTWVEAAREGWLGALAQQAGAPAEQLCPACQGSGEGMTMVDGGPDAYEVPCVCPHCNGFGGLIDAYRGLVALLGAEHKKYAQLCAKVVFATSAPAAQAERDELCEDTNCPHVGKTAAEHIEADAKDAARLDFMVQHEAWIAFSKDGESCRVFNRTVLGDAQPMLGWGAQHWRHDPRDAIDAAMSQSKTQEGA